MTFPRDKDGRDQGRTISVAEWVSDGMRVPNLAVIYCERPPFSVIFISQTPENSSLFSTK